MIYIFCWELGSDGKWHSEDDLIIEFEGDRAGAEVLVAELNGRRINDRSEWVVGG